MGVRKKYLETVGLFNHSIQAGLFSSIFFFSSNVGGIRIIFERSLHAMLFPIAITPDAIASLLSFFRFANAKNKNLGKTFDLIYIPTKAALVFTAVFAGLSVTAVNSLFLTAVISGILYHGALAVYNLYQLQKLSKNSDAYLKLRQLYKNNLINNSLSTLVGVIVTAAIVLTMILVLPAIALAIAGIGTAVMLMLATTYSVYRHFKKPTTPLLPVTKATEPLADDIQSEVPLATGYYACKFRSEKLTGNFDNDKQFLRVEIENKIRELNDHIAVSKGKTRERFFSETSKRQNKILFLQTLDHELKALSLSRNNVGFDAIENILLTANPGVFQSFLRAKSDVGDIADAIKSFLDRYRLNIEATRPEPVASTSKCSAA